MATRVRYFDPMDYDVDLDTVERCVPDKVLQKYSWPVTAAAWLPELRRFAES